MFATTTQQNRNPVQRAVCMLLAAFIVTVGLATGALGMHVAERNAAAARRGQARAKRRHAGRPSVQYRQRRNASNVAHDFRWPGGHAQ